MENKRKPVEKVDYVQLLRLISQRVAVVLKLVSGQDRQDVLLVDGAALLLFAAFCGAPIEDAADAYQQLHLALLEFPQRPLGAVESSFRPDFGNGRK